MDFEASFGNTKIYDDQVLNTVLAKQPFNIKIGASDNQLSTLIIYDLSAPSTRNPSNSPFIHFLEVNIPGSKIDQGDVLIHYTSPNPSPESGTHTYVIDLFQQKNKIHADIPHKREAFPLTQFVQFNNLKHESRLLFRVNPAANKFDGAGSGEWTQNLSEKDDKYCRCEIEVAGKQPAACNVERAWFQEREGHRCANPYAVCHKTVQGESGRPECGQNYIFENIPDNELVGYASLNRISIPQPYNRQALIQTLYQYEANKKAGYQQLEQDIATGHLRL